MVKTPRKLIGALALAGLLSAVGVVAAQVPGTSPAPQATPLPPHTTLGMPETVPKEARGVWTQAEWTAYRQHCLDLFSEVAAAQTMSPQQIKALKPFSQDEYEGCRMSWSSIRTPDAPPGPVGGLINPAMPPIYPRLSSPPPGSASGFPAVRVARHS